MSQSTAPRFVARKDLLIVRQRLADHWQWIVTDPVQDLFYRFDQAEISILNALRSAQSVEQLGAQIRSELRLNLTEAELKSFLYRLVNDNLISVVKPGEGSRYWQQNRKRKLAQASKSMLSLLAIKLPGINPDFVLRRLAWIGALLFRPLFVLLFSLAGLATLIFGIFSFGQLWEKIPSTVMLMSPSHLFGFFVAFCIVKFLHELGHGLACNQYGGRCREMGILFLVFMPCLYCDVSDMWTQPKKWKRIMVSAAGIYVEMTIALLCFWGWYFSAPGLANSLMFSVFMLGTINTVFINGNPLLKYDGYFVLSDLTNSPNLAIDAGKQLKAFANQWLYRFPRPVRTGFVPWHLSYAVLSTVYRWFILATILTVIYKFFEYLELKSFGLLLVGFIFITIMVPIMRTILSFSQGLYPRRWGNWAIAFGVVAIFAFVFLNFGFRKRVFVQADMQVAQPEIIYASDRGLIVTFVEPGQSVLAGQKIAEIRNDDYQLEQIELSGRLTEAKQRLEGLKIKSSLGVNSKGELEFLEKHVQNLDKELAQLKQKIGSLSIQAGQDGQIVTALPEEDPDRNVRSRTSNIGSAFSPINKNRSVDKGEMICMIGNRQQLCGFARVDQSQVDYIKIGHPVAVFVPHSKTKCFGKVSQISLVGEPQKRSGGPDSSEPDTINRTFLVTFVLETPAAAIQHGSKTKVVILGEKMTVARHCYDFLQRTFRL